jgi:ABC-2 type transport system permease protein
LIEQLDEGLEIQEFESERAMKNAILAQDLSVGVTFSPDFIAKLMQGFPDRIDVYYAADFPEEFQDIYEILLQEIAFLVRGQPLNIEVNEVILGVDTAGKPVAPRERMVPLIAVFILMIETMGLASLLTSEIEAGTLQALLITPMRMEGLFLGKGISGVGMAFTQAAFLIAVTGGLGQQPLLILAVLFLGALLVTGIGFLIASIAKDLVSVMAWGIPVILILSLPAFNVLFPGTVSEWIKFVPTYYLANTVFEINNFGAGFQGVAGNLLNLLLFSVAFFGLGVFVLRRKFR